MTQSFTLPVLIDRSVGIGETTILKRDGSRETSTHADLVRRSQNAAAGLLGVGARRGDRVAILTGSPFDFIVGAMATWRIGAAVVPLPRPSRARFGENQTETLLSRLRASGAKMLLGAGGGPPAGVSTPYDEISSLEVHGQANDSPDEGDPHDDALVLFSSGSTSDPKGVRLSQRAVAASLEADRSLGYVAGSRTRFVRWGELHYAAGLFWSFLRPFLYDSDSTVLSTERFLAHPSVWVEEIAASGVTVAGGPNIAFALAARYLESAEPESLDLSGWKVAVCSGEAVNAATLERFARAARSYGFDPASFLVRYSSTEAGPITRTEPGQRLKVVALDRLALSKGHAMQTQNPDRVQEVVSVGLPVPEVSVKIVDPGGSDLPELRTGEVMVRSPTMMEGYVEGTESEASFVEGWLRTGDVGYLDGGRLYITGRLEGSIIVKGKNVWLEDVENVVSRIDGVQGCMALATRNGETEGMVLLIERSMQDETDVRLKREIKKVVLATAGVSPARLVLMKPSSLPRTASGKLARGQASRLYESGGLASVDD